MSTGLCTELSFSYDIVITELLRSAHGLLQSLPDPQHPCTHKSERKVDPTEIQSKSIILSKIVIPEFPI